MKKLLKYMKGYEKECILGPLFKLLEASFELCVPLVVAGIVDVGIANSDRGYILKMCGLLVLLGAVGAPVFSGFNGGAGALVGTTGGYILGFLLCALTMWAVEAALGKSLWALGLGMVLGLIVCYVFGTAWFMVLYTRASGPVSLGTVLGWCVIPFIGPDLIKIAVALALSGRLRRHVA